MIIIILTILLVKMWYYSKLSATYCVFCFDNNILYKVSNALLTFNFPII
jgi:hypothetical protein